MAFIPIDAKADMQGQKKGKLTPAQHAQLNAWCLASKTGILDIYNNTTKKYDRCEATAKTYTITNDKATVVFNKGYIVICGRLVECEQSTSVEINTKTMPEGKIVLRYELSSNQEKEFYVTTKNTALDKEDLNENPIKGKYDFELYSYKTSNGALNLEDRTMDYVPDIGGKLEQFITILTGTGVIGEGTPPLQAYDKSKGTIEERLTRLGFKEATITGVNTNFISSISAYQQGKIVALIVKIKDSPVATSASPTLNVGVVSGIDLDVIGEKLNAKIIGETTPQGVSGGGGYIVYSYNTCLVEYDASNKKINLFARYGQQSAGKLSSAKLTGGAFCNTFVDESSDIYFVEL